jgi:hypothetical protein
MSDRTFHFIFDGKKGGLVKGSTPLSAAKKAYKKLSFYLKKSTVKFELQETTKDSKKKVYGPYKGYLDNEKINVKLVRVNNALKVYKPHKYILKGGLGDLWTHRCFPSDAADYIISCHATSNGLNPRKKDNYTKKNPNRTLVSYVKPGDILSDECAFIMLYALTNQQQENVNQSEIDDCMENINCSDQMINLHTWVNKDLEFNSWMWGIFDCTNADKEQWSSAIDCRIQKWSYANSSPNKGYKLQDALNWIHDHWLHNHSNEFNYYNVHVLACG